MLHTITQIMEGEEMEGQNGSIVWNSLANRLKEEGKEICDLNHCTNDNHYCESYAYITKEGTCLDICSSDYFCGYHELLVAAIPICSDFHMTGEELREEVEEQIDVWNN